MIVEHLKWDKRVSLILPVIWWLSGFTAWLIMPMEQGERLFRDDVRSTVRDQTNRAPHYAKTKNAGMDGRREKSWERESLTTHKPCYAVVTWSIGVFIHWINIFRDFWTIIFLVYKVQFFMQLTIYYRCVQLRYIMIYIYIYMFFFNSRFPFNKYREIYASSQY